MREQVCIVLNERESPKAKAAEALSLRLKDSGITSSRIPVTSEIESVLKQRLPRIVVVDYLLGDYSTGLDILSSLNSLDEDRRPKVIFLTDEPSLQVAVEALREGAVHYIELDDAQAIEKVTAEAREILSSIPSSTTRINSVPTLDDLVFGAPSTLKVRNQLQENAVKRSPIVFVHGAPGTGVTTTARALRGMQKGESFTRSLNLTHTQESLLEVAGLKPQREELHLGLNLNLLVENIDEDDGQFLAFLAEHQDSLWPTAHAAENNSYLIVCSNDIQCMQAWQKALNVPIIQVPHVAERKEDMAALVQRFIREAEEFAERKVKPFAPELITWLSAQKWPGELRQLRAVIIDAAIGSSIENEDIKAALESRLELWNEQASLQEPLPLDPLSAAAALELSGYRYQAAAARLGCSTRKLYSVLHSAANKKETRA